MATLQKIDWPGMILSLTGSSLLVISLEQGGVQFSWRSLFIILMLVGSSLCFVGFGAWEYVLTPREARMKMMPLFPTRLVSSRVVAATLGQVEKSNIWGTFTDAPQDCVLLWLSLRGHHNGTPATLSDRQWRYSRKCWSPYAPAHWRNRIGCYVDRNFHGQIQYRLALVGVFECPDDHWLWAHVNFTHRQEDCENLLLLSGYPGLWLRPHYGQLNGCHPHRSRSERQQ
jgi:hypothetical protein